MEQFYVGIAAALGLVFKVGIALQTVTRTKVASAFNILLILMIFGHVGEFFTLMNWAKNPELAYQFLSFLIVVQYFTCAAWVNLAFTLNPTNLSAQIKSGFFVFAVLLSVLHSQGLMIIGAIETDYSVVTDQGTFYFLFLLMIVLTLIAVITNLYRGIRSSDSVIAMRCKFTLQATTPIVAVAVFVVGGKLLGLNSSSALITPIASTFFVYFLMYQERGDLIVFKLKWAVFWFLIWQAIKVLTGRIPLSHKNFTTDLERFQIGYAMQLMEYKVDRVAKLLDMSWPTVKRRIQEYGLDPEPETVRVEN